MNFWNTKPNYSGTQENVNEILQQVSGRVSLGVVEKKIQVNQGLRVYPLAGWRSDLAQSFVFMEMFRDFS